MIGTSISVQNSGEMQYPSITICESEITGGIFANGQLFDSLAEYYNWKMGTNTTPFHYDLKKEFRGLSSKMKNMSSFILNPSDIDNRDTF